MWESNVKKQERASPSPERLLSLYNRLFHHPLAYCALCFVLAWLRFVFPFLLPLPPPASRQFLGWCCLYGIRHFALLLSPNLPFHRLPVYESLLWPSDLRWYFLTELPLGFSPRVFSSGVSARSISQSDPLRHICSIFGSLPSSPLIVIWGLASPSALMQRFGCFYHLLVCGLLRTDLCVNVHEQILRIGPSACYPDQTY